MTKVQINYYDGSQSEKTLTDEEIPFPEGKLIVSRTDTDGIITHCNQAFVDMSGFEKDELIGQPHCVLRHPDMPSAAFKDLWDTVKDQGKKWRGYVKNLRKDGSFYWVYAVVVPNVRDGKTVGFASIRRKPSRTKINELTETYKAMLAEEKKA
ncbi:MAG: PAS domain-containing protein [Xanthomonadales bacterium]|nr:PAS domain-containing protein [Xanthomonadales bacterium]